MLKKQKFSIERGVNHCVGGMPIYYTFQKNDLMVIRNILLVFRLADYEGMKRSGTF
jgi:hypothetical protein